MASRVKDNVPTYRFSYTMTNVFNQSLSPYPQDVQAKDLGHALQKISPCLHDECDKVIIWRAEHD